MDFKVTKVDAKHESSIAEKEQAILDEKEAQDKALLEKNDNPPPVSKDNVVGALNEEVVSGFLKEKYGFEFETLEDLKKPKAAAPELSESVSAFAKYEKETGRGLKDYFESQRDYSQMKDKDVVKKYFNKTEEGLDPEDITLMMDDFSYDPELDDDVDIKKKQLELKKVANKARKFFDTEKESYKIPLESSRSTLSKEDQEALANFKEQQGKAANNSDIVKQKTERFMKKTEELFSGEFKGFEFDIDGKGTMISYKPGDADELKKSQLNVTNFISKFLDEDGMMKDAKGYHKGLNAAMNPEKLARFFYEKGMNAKQDQQMKREKNIDMGSQRKARESYSKKGLTVTAMSSPSSKGLVIRSPKNRGKI